MWHIRKQYINELRAANSIQALKSSGKEFNLPDCLERMLSILSSGDEMDCGNKLRTIRDDYILSVLEDFGFIPRIGVKFNRGAQLDFLADRFYSPNGKDYAYFLKKSIGSPGVFQMLRASKVILNASSHGFGLYRRNMMMSVVHSILGALCDLEEMIDRGLFDRAVDCADYYIKVEKKGVKNEVVCQLPDNNDYWYAGNIHLDSRTCANAGIRVGDCVDVDKPSFENKPVINDAVQIYLYSNHIKKSN